MPEKKQPPVQQTAIGNDNIQVVGSNNIITRITNFFAGDKETTDQRNRRIMLGHVENFWVKGILEKSLHGAALLELGIKEDPDALTYPWAIKREANRETLPAGTSMLEIFQEFGMGRSLLILGAPGSGKTTMLLELTRQLIERAREDVTEPIPVVFNLSSWTEKLTLADWLARELNVIYTIPKKIAPTWVEENKMLLLLDGLDEVQQESRDKCVDAINQFRKENGLTSMAVCSRMQDYAELKAKLSLDGAIEIQPLTSNQVDGYFDRYGEGLAGIRQVLEKDTVLREMAETPLFLSIMTLAYRDTKSNDILVSNNMNVQRRHLFDAYVERMFKRLGRSNKEQFRKSDTLHWLSWLAENMVTYRITSYVLENIYVFQFSTEVRRIYVTLSKLIGGPFFGLLAFLISGLIVGLINGAIAGMLVGIIMGFVFGWLFNLNIGEYIDNPEGDILTWDWKEGFMGLIIGLIAGSVVGLVAGLIVSFFGGISAGLIVGLSATLGIGLYLCVSAGLKAMPISKMAYPGQRLSIFLRNFVFVLLFVGVLGGLIIGYIIKLFGGSLGLSIGFIIGLSVGLKTAIDIGGLASIEHYILRFIMARKNLLPWRTILFLNYCTDLIFLRRVGGGYIFVHRLLMEHFADMYPADEK